MKRCNICKVPLEGALSKIYSKILNYQPAAEDPSLCNRCFPKSRKQDTYICQICNKTVEEASALTHVKAEEYLLHLIKKDHPEWKEHKDTCPECVAYYRELIKKAQI